MSGLPKGWTRTTVAAVTSVNPKHPADADRSQLVSFVPMPAVDDLSGTIPDTSNVRPLADIWTGYTHFADGDVIFAKITPCMENGKIAVAEGLANGLACGSTEFHVFRSDGAIDPKYLWRHFRQRSFRAIAERSMTGAVGQRRVPKQFLEDTEISLPPLAEQKRIAAKLDALSAKSARARTELARIECLVSRYKHSVLQNAFDGKLTADFRSKGELEAWKYQAAEKACAKVQSGGTPKAGFATAGPPFLKVYNVVSQEISFDHKPQFIPNTVHNGELKKSIAIPGDVIMNIVGPPLGKIAIIPPTYPEWNLNQALTLFRPSKAVSSKWIYYYLLSGRPVASVIDETKGSAGQVNISLSQCRSFQFPVPTASEQHEIVRRIEAAFARIDRLATEAKRALDLLGKLDEAILAKAFRGELVPQDENDEPADVLLDRIRAERANAPKTKRGGRTAAARS